MTDVGSAAIVIGAVMLALLVFVTIDLFRGDPGDET